MKWLINKNFINRALKFYSIMDDNYKQRCYEVIDEINKSDDFKKIVSDVYSKLFIDKNYNIRKLWKTKSKEELFGKIQSPFITNVLLLFGYKIHEENMKKYHFDEKQIKLHKKRVKDALLNDIKIRGYDGIRLSQMLWGIYFVNLKIIEVGRLQYEFIEFNPINENEYKRCIKIHIPSGEKLDIYKVKESLKGSKKEIRKYFKIDEPEYFCTSWLLSKQIRKLVDDNSNIALFYELFDVIEREDATNDLLNFIFDLKDCTDFSILPENTSLQKRVKELLLTNIKINVGLGVLKNREKV